MTGFKELSEAEKLELINELALGEKTQAVLGEQFGVSRPAITQFKNKHTRDIDLARANYLEKYQELWIKKQERRFAEMQYDADLLRGKRNPAAIRARVAIFKQMSEEMGQLPPRLQVAIVPVQHQIIGVDTRELT